MEDNHFSGAINLFNLEKLTVFLQDFKTGRKKTRSCRSSIFKRAAFFLCVNFNEFFPANLIDFHNVCVPYNSTKRNLASRKIVHAVHTCFKFDTTSFYIFTQKIFFQSIQKYTCLETENRFRFFYPSLRKYF